MITSVVGQLNSRLDKTEDWETQTQTQTLDQTQTQTQIVTSTDDTDTDTDTRHRHGHGHGGNTQGTTTGIDYEALSGRWASLTPGIN